MVRIPGAGGERLCVLLDHRVARAVDVEIEPEVEEVLMMRGQHAVRHEVAKAIMVMIIPASLRARGKRLHAFDRHNSGEQDFHFQCAVLMEDPIEAVFVIADVGEEGKDELSGPARFIVTCYVIGVFP